MKYGRKYIVLVLIYYLDPSVVQLLVYSDAELEVVGSNPMILVFVSSFK